MIIVEARRQQQFDVKVEIIWMCRQKDACYLLREGQDMLVFKINTWFTKWLNKQNNKKSWVSDS